MNGIKLKKTNPPPPKTTMCQQLTLQRVTIHLTSMVLYIWECIGMRIILLLGIKKQARHLFPYKKLV